MEEIYKKINYYNSLNVKVTNRTYASRVYKLQQYGQNIEDYEKTIAYIKSNYKEKTYKSFLTSIVVYLKAIDNKTLAERYGSEMKIVNDRIQKKEKDNIASQKESENLVTRNEIKKLIDNLKLNMDSMELSQNKIETMKQHLVLNLYYLILPLRNDYVGCSVVNSEPYFLDQTKNYIILNNSTLLLNRYKTSRYYGEKRIDLPEPLVNIIKDYMTSREKVYPQLVGNTELLLTRYLKPMNQVNLTQLLNRIFKMKVSSTMLRKSYISEKYPVTHTQNQMESDASAMGHSVSTQQSTYRKRT